MVTAGRHSLLARAVREAAQAGIADGWDRPPTYEDALARVRSETLSRRDLLRWGAVAGAGVTVWPGRRRHSATFSAPATGRQRRHRPTEHDARVVVVGAGLGGLTAAYQLSRQGVHVECYEARDRVGGRCWTARGFADGQTAEHGGEFIDSRHVHIRQLARELGLTLDDLSAGWVSGSRSPTFVDGKLRDPRVIFEATAPVTRAVTEAAARIGVIRPGHKPSDRAYSYPVATPAAREMDRVTMREWLERDVPAIARSWVADWYDEVMGSWYGLEMRGLSALNWVDFYVIPAPGADERWHVHGGNDQVTTLTADRLPPGSLHLEAPLEALSERQDGSYELRFGGASYPVVADIVVLSLPFTTLRHVDLSRAGFSAGRVRAIEQLAMGQDAKLLLQYDARPWTFTVEGGPWSGVLDRTDPSYDTWESSTDQPGRSGLITVYAGGRTGASWSSPTPHGPAPDGLTGETVRQIDDLVPGTGAHFNGTAWLDWWTGDAWTRGSYAAFAPTQMTRFWHYLGLAEGKVHFAGEHTSTYSQGYLNGGVESGDRVAIEIMDALGIPVPKRLAILPYSTFYTDRRRP
jgi:monoamine oxidase